MEISQDTEFIKVSDLQKMTSGKLRKLSKGGIFITEYSKPCYILLRLEEFEERKDIKEYLYLTSRPHAWKKQLFIKGLNMSAAQLNQHMQREGWTPQKAAEEFDLPLEAVLESIHYIHHHRKLIDMENLEEQRRLENLSR